MYAGTTSGAAGSRIGLTEARFPVDPGRRLPLAPISHPDALAVAGKVSVGIVGSGPSAMYAADDLLRYPQVSVTMYERLDRPFGLARFGVAPTTSRPAPSCACSTTSRATRVWRSG